jgi:hypothetical protein
VGQRERFVAQYYDRVAPKDPITMELSRHCLGIHLIVHPSM